MSRGPPDGAIIITEWSLAEYTICPEDPPMAPLLLQNDH